MKSSGLHYIAVTVWFSATLLFVSGLVSCRSRGKDVLGEKEMVSLMADMRLAEAYLEGETYGSGGFTGRRQLAEGVLAAHGVTQAELDSTLAYYGRNLDDYSVLYEKVEKEIESRKRADMNEGVREPEQIAEGNNLWPYGVHGVVTPHGIADGWVFSMDNIELEKGESLEWYMHFGRTVNVNGVFGVEYEDGSGEAVSNHLMGRTGINMELFPDTARKIKRIYGSLRLRDMADAPLFADSIRLRTLPFDSVAFNRYHPQRKYGVPAHKTKTEIIKDSVDIVDSDEVGKPAEDATSPVRKGNLPVRRVTDSPRKEKSMRRPGEVKSVKPEVVKSVELVELKSVEEGANVTPRRSK